RRYGLSGQDQVPALGQRKLHHGRRLDRDSRGDSHQGIGNVPPSLPWRVPGAAGGPPVHGEPAALAAACRPQRERFLTLFPLLPTRGARSRGVPVAGSHPIPATRRATFAIAGAQSPNGIWRKTCTEGYHGLAVSATCQRQSGRLGHNRNTVDPMAPARCAVDVSTATTASSDAIIAAVS